MESDHYKVLSAKYDEYYRYSDEYIDYFTQKIIQQLPVNDNEAVVEIGAGTCLFAEELIHRRLDIDMICVDNSDDMLRRNTNRNIRKVFQGAEEFVRQKCRYDRVYMKEFIHHIDAGSRPDLFRGIYRQLNPGGTVLILVEPQRLNYPLFGEALRLFQNKQPSRADLMDDLKHAGFSASFEVISFPIRVSKSDYLDRVRNRYMSVLEKFSDAELKKGLEEIDRFYPGDQIEYLEIFYSIRGVKNKQ
ncbi:MAG: class I SAM-dependent methyltransferase [Chitinophagaceae bacterium]